MHGAGAAQRLAATELGPGHAEHVEQHPQQRGVAVDIDLMGCAVDLQHESHGCLSVAAADRKQPADLDSAGRLRASMGACSSRTKADNRPPIASLWRVKVGDSG